MTTTSDNAGILCEAIELPDMHSREENDLWRSDQRQVCAFLDSHTKLYRNDMTRSAITTYCYDRNVDGTYGSGKAVDNPLSRYIGSIQFPLTMYRCDPRGSQMADEYQRVYDYHRRFNIVDKRGEPTPRIGIDLFRQIFQYLMTDSWFNMDAVLRQTGNEGIEPATLLSALRVNMMAARRMGIHGMEGKSAHDIREDIRLYAERAMMKEDNHSRSHLRGIESAFSAMEVASRMFPSNPLHAAAYDFALNRFGTKVFDGLFLAHIPNWCQQRFPWTNRVSSATHKREMGEFLALFSDEVNRILRIPEIVEAVLAGQSFEEFADMHLKDFAE